VLKLEVILDLNDVSPETQAPVETKAKTKHNIQSITESLISKEPPIKNGLKEIQIYL